MRKIANRQIIDQAMRVLTRIFEYENVINKKKKSFDSKNQKRYRR
jgi:hypothetical protein